MARQERGVYEPSDEVRVFDGAEDEDDDEGSRLPLVIVGALLVLAMFGGLVWLAYSEGVSRGRTETPILAAATGPARVAPAQPGGANVQYQGFKIYEQPAPPDDEAQTTPPAPPPQQVAKAEPVPAPVAPKPVATTPAAKPVAAAAPPAAAPAATTPPSSTPRAALTPPPPMKKSVPVTPPSNTATAPPRQLPGVAVAKPAESKPAPTPVAAPTSATPTSATKGAYVLQIGAYKSQEDADAAWKTYKAKHAALLAGYGPDVQKADLGDKGTWYRLRVAGFADQAVASALCDRLKADGGSSCFPGK